MSAETQVKASGAWNVASSVHCKVSGTWKPVRQIWAKVSGVWQKVYAQALAVALANATVNDSSFTGTCYFKLKADGTVEDSEFNSYPGEWLTAGVPEDAECRATVTSGSLSSGTTGTWLALSADRTWQVNRFTDGSKNCVFTLEIRRASDGTVLATASISITAWWSTL